MKNITEAQLLLNNEVRVTFTQSQFHGQTGIVRKVMADGRTLEIDLDCPNSYTDGKTVLLDVTFVSEIQEPYNWGKQEQSLGPDANSVLPKNRL